MKKTYQAYFPNRGWVNLTEYQYADFVQRKYRTRILCAKPVTNLTANEIRCGYYN